MFKSPFMDPDHGHIVTGNLKVAENYILRVLLSKGPSYREANNIDWGKVYLCIRNGISDYVKKWSDKEKVDVRVLSEWDFYWKLNPKSRF